MSFEYICVEILAKEIERKKKDDLMIRINMNLFFRKSIETCLYTNFLFKYDAIFKMNSKI